MGLFIVERLIHAIIRKYAHSHPNEITTETQYTKGFLLIWLRKHFSYYSAYNNKVDVEIFQDGNIKRTPNWKNGMLYVPGCDFLYLFSEKNDDRGCISTRVQFADCTHRSLLMYYGVLPRALGKNCNGFSNRKINENILNDLKNQFTDKITIKIRIVYGKTSFLTSKTLWKARPLKWICDFSRVCRKIDVCKKFSKKIHCRALIKMFDVLMKKMFHQRQSVLDFFSQVYRCRKFSEFF